MPSYTFCIFTGVVSNWVHQHALFVESSQRPIKTRIVAMIVDAIGEEDNRLPSFNSAQGRKRQRKCIVELSALPGSCAVDCGFKGARSLVKLLIMNLVIKRDHFHSVPALQLLDKSDRRLLNQPQFFS